MEKVYALFSHGADSAADAYFTQDTIVNLRTNSTYSYGSQTVIIPINLQSMESDTGGTSNFRFRIAWLDNSVEKFVAFTYIKKDKANNKYIIEMKTYEYIGGTSYTTDSWDIPDGVRSIYIASQIQIDKSLLTATCANSISLSRIFDDVNTNEESGVDGALAFDEVTVGLNAYSNSDETDKLYFSEPILTDPNTGPTGIVNTFPLVPLERTDDNDFTVSESSYDYISHVKDWIEVPFDYQELYTNVMVFDADQNVINVQSWLQDEADDPGDSDEDEDDENDLPWRKRLFTASWATAIIKSFLKREVRDYGDDDQIESLSELVSGQFKNRHGRKVPLSGEDL